MCSVEIKLSNGSSLCSDLRNFDLNHTIHWNMDKFWIAFVVCILLSFASCEIIFKDCGKCAKRFHLCTSIKSNEKKLIQTLVKLNDPTSCHMNVFDGRFTINNNLDWLVHFDFNIFVFKNKALKLGNSMKLRFQIVTSHRALVNWSFYQTQLFNWNFNYVSVTL